MQRIPQKLIVAVLVIVAVSAFVVAGKLDADAGLDAILVIAAGLGIGYEAAKTRSRT